MEEIKMVNNEQNLIFPYQQFNLHSIYLVFIRHKNIRKVSFCQCDEVKYPKWTYTYKTPVKQLQTAIQNK